MLKELKYLSKSLFLSKTASLEPKALQIFFTGILITILKKVHFKESFCETVIFVKSFSVVASVLHIPFRLETPYLTIFQYLHLFTALDNKFHSMLEETYEICYFPLCDMEA